MVVMKLKMVRKGVNSNSDTIYVVLSVYPPLFQALHMK